MRLRMLPPWWDVYAVMAVLLVYGGTHLVLMAVHA